MTPRIQQYAREAGSTAEAVCAHAAMPLHGHPVAKARREVITRLRADGFTLTQIARWFNIDHSTVSYWSAGFRKQPKKAGGGFVREAF